MNHAPLKVYVAGAAIERAHRAIPVMRALREQGVQITHDWAVDMQQYSNAENSDADVPDDVRKRCATLDMNAVRQADFVLLLAANERGSSGSWVELGLALAFGVPVIVAGSKAKRTIFTSLAYHIVPDDVTAVQFLGILNREKAREA